ncbi:glycosyltransferase 25 family member-like [Amphibalanus amphitrite]|uniref:glycosyltransferase 25 family member-like n=1 Tax=Amphibalanus amphitrite TaxID=1232801 RepID=UPI001C907545|nr:glycosyltransferase 25 family member-like [Amphibalanus amphitrite]
MLLMNASFVLVTLAVLKALAVAQGSNPSVMIVLLVRNKEAYLPYTLSQLSRLDYPKERLALWIASDHNQDRSAEILHTWLERYNLPYLSVEAVVNASSPPLRPDERGAVQSPGRLRAVGDMKQEALKRARTLGMDMVWFLDADVVLHDRYILRRLQSVRKPVVAPMLRSVGGYSNFQTSIGRTSPQEEDAFSRIYSGRVRGCFAVPLVRSCVLMDLRDPRTAGLTFVSQSCELQPEVETLDDAVALAISSRNSGLKMTICNGEDFGLMPVPLSPTQELKDEWQNLLAMKLETLIDYPPMSVVPLMRLFLPPPPTKSRLGFDRIYVIGLERRPERWRRLKACFDEIGVEAVRMLAVDGRKLTDEFLEERNIHPRGEGRKKFINKGEVGCSLSHYYIWRDVIKQNLSRVIILEDDSHPSADFPARLRQLVDEADRLRPEWDFLYLFREAAFPDDFEPVEGSEHLIRPGFSYTTLAYALTRSGAETLVRDDPLKNLLCVDHYIPLMSGEVPFSEWMEVYPSAGTLRVYSGRENIIEPVKRIGEHGFVSDCTEVDDLFGEVSYGNEVEECNMETLT